MKSNIEKLNRRRIGDRNREGLNAALAEGRTHFDRLSSRQLWLHPDTGQVVRADQLTGEQLGRAELVGHEVIAEPCPVDRYKLLRAPLILKRMKSLSQVPPVRRSGHAPRPATNTRRRGSRRSTARSGDSGDDGPGEPPGPALAPPPRANYVVVLRDGRRLSATDAKHLPGGWLRAATIRTRVDYDEDADLGRRVFDRLVTRRFPPTAIVQVVELDDDDTAHDAEAVAFP